MSEADPFRSNSIHSQASLPQEEEIAWDNTGRMVDVGSVSNVHVTQIDVNNDLVPPRANDDNALDDLPPLQLRPDTTPTLLGRNARVSEQETHHEVGGTIAHRAVGAFEGGMVGGAVAGAGVAAVAGTVGIGSALSAAGTVLGISALGGPWGLAVGAVIGAGIIAGALIGARMRSTTPQRKFDQTIANLNNDGVMLTNRDGDRLREYEQRGELKEIMRIPWYRQFRLNKSQQADIRKSMVLIAAKTGKPLARLKKDRDRLIAAAREGTLGQETGKHLLTEATCRKMLGEIAEAWGSSNEPQGIMNFLTKNHDLLTASGAIDRATADPTSGQTIALGYGIAIMDRIKARGELENGDIDRMLRTVPPAMKDDVEALREHVGKPVGAGTNDTNEALAKYVQLLAKAHAQIITDPPNVLVHALPASVEQQMTALGRQFGDHLAQGSNGKDVLTTLINTSSPQSLVNDHGDDNPDGGGLASAGFPVPQTHRRQEIEQLLMVDRQQVPEDEDVKPIQLLTLKQLATEGLRKAEAVRKGRQNVIELRRTNRENAISKWNEAIQKFNAVEQWVGDYLNDHDITDIALDKQDLFKSQLHALAHHNHDGLAQELKDGRLDRYAATVRAQLEDDKELADVQNAYQKMSVATRGLVDVAQNDPTDTAAFAQHLAAALSHAATIPGLDRVHGKPVAKNDSPPGNLDQIAVMNRFSRQAVADLTPDQARTLYQQLTARDGAGSVMLELLNKHAMKVSGEPLANDLAASKLNDMAEAFLTALAEKADIKTASMEITDLKQGANNSVDELKKAFPAFQKSIEATKEALPQNWIEDAGDLDLNASFSVMSDAVHDPAETRPKRDRLGSELSLDGDGNNADDGLLKSSPGPLPIKPMAGPFIDDDSDDESDADAPAIGADFQDDDYPAISDTVADGFVYCLDEKKMNKLKTEILSRANQNRYKALSKKDKHQAKLFIQRTLENWSWMAPKERDSKSQSMKGIPELHEVLNDMVDVISYADRNMTQDKLAKDLGNTNDERFTLLSRGIENYKKTVMDKVLAEQDKIVGEPEVIDCYKRLQVLNAKFGDLSQKEVAEVVLLAGNLNKYLKGLKNQQSNGQNVLSKMNEGLGRIEQSFNRECEEDFTKWLDNRMRIDWVDHCGKEELQILLRIMGNAVQVKT